MNQLSVFLNKLFIPSEPEYCHQEQKHDECVDEYNIYGGLLSRKPIAPNIKLIIYAMSQSK
jgi:hypothetical protein